MVAVVHHPGRERNDPDDERRPAEEAERPTEVGEHDGPVAAGEDERDPDRLGVEPQASPAQLGCGRQHRTPRRRDRTSDRRAMRRRPHARHGRLRAHCSSLTATAPPIRRPATCGAPPEAQLRGDGCPVRSMSNRPIQVGQAPLYRRASSFRRRSATRPSPAVVSAAITSGHLRGRRPTIRHQDGSSSRWGDDQPIQRVKEVRRVDVRALDPVGGVACRRRSRSECSRR